MQPDEFPAWLGKEVIGKLPSISRRQFLIGAAAAAAATSGANFVGSKTRALATPTSTRLHPQWTLVLRGIDRVDGRLFAIDNTNKVLRQSENWAVSWSSSKGLPTETSYPFATKMIRFKGNLYLVARDNNTGKCCVWRTPPASGDAPFTWAKVFSGRTQTSAALGTNFNCDASYLYLGEYGDPAGGPNLYRSVDGVTWKTTFTGTDQTAAIGTTLRHIHAVAADPYTPGHIYMTSGDFGPSAGACLWRSTNYGALDSWKVAILYGAYQSVQISFDPNWIWLAADNHKSTVSIVNRSALSPQNASSNWHFEIPVPGGSSGDAYYINAYFGAVHPSTGIYYCAAVTGNYGNTQGLFSLAGVGEALAILDPGGIDIQMGSEIFIAHGELWCGQWRHPLVISSATPTKLAP
jgi:hypothetical protein